MVVKGYHGEEIINILKEEYKMTDEEWEEYLEEK